MTGKTNFHIQDNLNKILTHKKNYPIPSHWAKRFNKASVWELKSGNGHQKYSKAKKKVICWQTFFIPFGRIFF